MCVGLLGQWKTLDSGVASPSSLLTHWLVPLSLWGLWFPLIFHSFAQLKPNLYPNLNQTSIHTLSLNINPTPKWYICEGKWAPPQCPHFKETSSLCLVKNLCQPSQSHIYKPARTPTHSHTLRWCEPAVVWHLIILCSQHVAVHSLERFIKTLTLVSMELCIMLDPRHPNTAWGAFKDRVYSNSSVSVPLTDLLHSKSVNVSFVQAANSNVPLMPQLDAQMHKRYFIFCFLFNLADKYAEMPWKVLITGHHLPTLWCASLCIKPFWTHIRLSGLYCWWASSSL